MRLDPATDEQIRDIALRMRDSDFREFSAVAEAETRTELAEQLTARYGGRDDMICAGLERPIAVGSMVLARPGVATLLFFATDDFRKIALPLTRWIKWELFPRYREAGVHRVECVSIEGHDAAHRWIEMLGLRREATMPGYGKGRETFHQFAMVKDQAP